MCVEQNNFFTKLFHWFGNNNNNNNNNCYEEKMIDPQRFLSEFIIQADLEGISKELINEFTIQVLSTDDVWQVGKPALESLLSRNDLDEKVRDVALSTLKIVEFQNPIKINDPKSRELFNSQKNRIELVIDEKELNNWNLEQDKDGTYEYSGCRHLDDSLKERVLKALENPNIKGPVALSFLIRGVGCEFFWKEVNGKVKHDTACNRPYGAGYVSPCPYNTRYLNLHLCTEETKCTNLQTPSNINGQNKIFFNKSQLPQFEELNAKKVPKPDPTALHVLPYKVITPNQGVRTSVAAATSLLIPGTNTLSNAKALKQIPFVSFNDDDGLKIYFSTSTNAKELCNRLNALDVEAKYCDEIFEKSFNANTQRYHASISIHNSDQIVQYLAAICKQSKQDIIALLDTINNEKSMSEATIQSIKEAAENQQNYKIEMLKSASDVIDIPNFRLSGSGVRQCIGAMASILLPGGNTLSSAKKMENIPFIQLQSTGPNRGLTLNFSDSDYAKRLYSGLNKVGFNSISCRNVDIEKTFGNNHYRYSQALTFHDPIEMIEFMRQICKLHPLDVKDLVEASGLKNTRLGETILFYNSVPLFKNIDLIHNLQRFTQNQVDIDKFSINFDEVNLPGMVDLPDDAFHLDPGPILIDALLNINFEDENSPNYISESFINDDGSPLPNAKNLNDKINILKDNMQTMLDVASGKINRYGMPNSVSGKKAYRAHLTKVLKHVAYMMNESNDKHVKSWLALSMAIGGGHCAARYVQEGMRAYSRLLANCEDPHYTSSHINSNLPLVDAQVLEILLKHLQAMRADEFMKLTSSIHSEYIGLDHRDISHTKTYYLKKFGKKLGIPGFEAAEYDDVFGSLAVIIDDNEFMKRFNSRYNPQTIVHYLRQILSYGSDSSLNATDMGRVIDFCKHHAPEEYFKTPSEFLPELFRDGYNDEVTDMVMDDSYIAQLLFLTGLFKQEI